MAFNFDGLIIFEMANNHQGSVRHGLRIVEEMGKIAGRYRIRAAVKLQYRDLDTFIHPDYVERKDVKHIPRFLETRLDAKDFQQLVMATHDAGMLSIITPFDEASVDTALNHGVDILKVASCSCMDWPLLGVIAKAGNPIICSTGGASLSDLDKIVTFFEHRSVRDLALLHCVGIYPTENKDQQLNFMRRMMVRYPQCAVGYSGHESPDNLRVATAAVAMGAKMLERHVGLPTEKVKLNAYSMNPEQTARWVEEILIAREICGPAEDKRVTETEAESLRSLQRGVYTREPVKKGEALTRGKVFFAMPVQPGQTTSKEYLETMVATRDYTANDSVQEARSFDPVHVLRSVVHEVKGLLREAQIATGQDYQIELSHHYGMESFRRFGATLVSFVNREYCKKLIILLPGQQHPSHAHKKKEETFQLLYGSMDLILDGEHRTMHPGDLQLVRRGQFHSFSTKTGCIFEEISTTHIKGDSMYEDVKIASLDPVQRKTVIENW